MFSSKASNQSVNRTPKAYRFWFPPLRSGAGYLRVIGPGRLHFGGLSAKALAPGLAAKPLRQVMAKAGKVAVGVSCQHHRQHGYSWRAPVAGPSVLNGNWAGGF